MAQTIVEQLNQIAKQGQLSHAYLIDGSDVLGRERLVQEMAANLFHRMDNRAVEQIQKQIQEQQHANFIWVRPDGRSIKIDQVREMINEMTRTSMSGGHRIYVLSPADRMTVEASNSLLKFLEEPTTGVHLFLLTDTKEALLPTIQSRCQWIHLPQPNRQTLIKQFQAAGLTQERSNWLTFQTNQLDEAIALDQQTDYFEHVEVRWRWFTQLMIKPMDAFLSVESMVLSQVENRDDALLYIEDLLLFTRDATLIAKKQSKNLARPDHLKEYQQLLQRCSLNNVINIASQLIETKRYIEANVGIRSAFEHLTLILSKQQKR
ncbi:hypothetical protein [Atopobacter phocae]|uniref:hypothetical protein n=1 Tax=Atopobacter phocae TaxID=136492 RepID=UPI00046FF4FB|nr:hypothetical protein [Atopobacter phocae]